VTHCWNTNKKMVKFFSKCNIIYNIIHGYFISLQYVTVTNYLLLWIIVISNELLLKVTTHLWLQLAEWWNNNYNYNYQKFSNDQHSAIKLQLQKAWWLQILLLIIYLFSVWFVLSSRPFDWGWYIAVILILILNAFWSTSLVWW